MLADSMPSGASMPDSESVEEAAKDVASNFLDALDWEERDTSKTAFWKHAVAGSCAGIGEHVIVFPLDTIKTNVQARSADGSKASFRSALNGILKENGAFGLFRGVQAIAWGCVPAHIALFGVYETTKDRFLDQTKHEPIKAAMCGASATFFHDAIITPMDVVKQRLQLGCYKGAIDCIKSIHKTEGSIALVRSMPATLMMNLPFGGVLVSANESLKKVLKVEEAAAEGRTAAAITRYFASAGLSAGLAAMLTMPLDVIKTRQQTQDCLMLKQCESCPMARLKVQQASQNGEPIYKGFVSTGQQIWRTEGVRGMWSGAGPRLFQAMPSAAVCWGTYETVKYFLQRFD